MQNKTMKELNLGENFTGFCIIRKKELRQTQNGELYLKLEIGDKSGRLNGKVWQEAQELYTVLKVGQMIKIVGTVQSYKNTREIHIQRLRAARQQESERWEDLLPKSDKDIQKQKKLFMEHFYSVKHDKLSLLLKQIFKEEEQLDKYLSLPSGKLWHHNYLHGNLEHLVCLLDMTEVLFCHYPFMKKELLKTAIILHNLGNLQQISLKGFIDYTTVGRLIGHPTLTFQRLKQEIEFIPDFPKELKMHLLHLILSQENPLEKTASVLPMTFEAIIFNQMIQLDILANATQRIIKNDRLPDSRWTKYNNLLQRFLYVGEITESS